MSYNSTESSSNFHDVKYTIDDETLSRVTDNAYSGSTSIHIYPGCSTCTNKSSDFTESSGTSDSIHHCTTTYETTTTNVCYPSSTESHICISPTTESSITDKRIPDKEQISTIIHGQCHKPIYHHIYPNDVVQHVDNTIYVNPRLGPIYIVLGGHNNSHQFRDNTSVTIKDISLAYQNGCSFNVFITVPTHTNMNCQTGIEIYDRDCALKVARPGTYVLNTSDGCVRFNYVKQVNAWMIITQLIGNHRVIPNSSMMM